MPIAKNLRYGNHLIPDVGLADRSEARGGTRTCTFGRVSDNLQARRPCLPESDGRSFKSALRPLGIFPFGRTLRGLGTSNVQALAKQLRARIKVEDAEPGSAVSVVHTHLAAVNDEAGDLPAEVAI